jgi:hypothetical protein
MPTVRSFSNLLALLLAVAGCTATGPVPQTPQEQQTYAAFQRDRDTCRRVAEAATDYVDPEDGDAVSRRSVRVEAETQSCLLARGWNDPEFDGWQGGRT